jgi:hypothetical protein
MNHYINLFNCFFVVILFLTPSSILNAQMTQCESPYCVKVDCENGDVSVALTSVEKELGCKATELKAGGEQNDGIYSCGEDIIKVLDFGSKSCLSRSEALKNDHKVYINYGKTLLNDPNSFPTRLSYQAKCSDREVRFQVSKKAPGILAIDWLNERLQIVKEWNNEDTELYQRLFTNIGIAIFKFQQRHKSDHGDPHLGNIFVDIEAVKNKKTDCKGLNDDCGVYFIDFDLMSGEINNHETGIIVRDLNAALREQSFQSQVKFRLSKEQNLKLIEALQNGYKSGL